MDKSEYPIVSKLQNALSIDKLEYVAAFEHFCLYTVTKLFIDIVNF